MKNLKFDIDQETKAANAKMTPAQLLEQYGFTPIYVGKRVTVGYTTMTFKFAYNGYKFLFSNVQAFVKWAMEVNLIPAKSMPPVKRGERLIERINPEFAPDLAHLAA